MPQLQQPSSKSKRKKPANPIRAGIPVMAAACAAVALAGAWTPARAIPVPTPPPESRSTSAPALNPAADVLPDNSSLFFVLDGTIGSHSKPGTAVTAHLRDPIILRGRTIAPAGTQVEIQVTQSSPAQAGNVDGWVDVYFHALRLPSGQMLPLITPSAHIDPHMTAGQASTRAVTDTVGDIFIPGHVLYHMLRKGADVTLRPGTIVRARTAAVLTFAHGTVAISTPPPFVTTLDTPHPDFVPAPVFTPPGFHPPTPKPTPTVRPTSTP